MGVAITDAIAVKFGLDAEEFIDGVVKIGKYTSNFRAKSRAEFAQAKREAMASLREWIREDKEAAQQAEKNAKRVQAAHENVSDSFGLVIRNALKLYAVFTAGKAVGDFVRDITQADAALGRLAKSLETTPEALSSLGKAVERGGGSADAAVGSFERLANAYNEVKLTGRSATYDMLSRLAGASGKAIRFGRDTQQTILDAANAAKALADRQGVSYTSSLLREAGLDPGTIALMVQGSGKVKEAFEKVRRLGGVVTKADTDNAQRFATALTDVTTISTGLGRTIWSQLSPAISEVLEKFVKWYEANGEWLRTEISEKVKLLADYIRSIDWDAIGRHILDFAHGADDAAKAVGGWKVALELLFGAWLFTKLFALLRLLGLVRLALGAGSGAGGIARLIALLGGSAVAGTAAAIVATSAVTDAGTPNAAKPSVITRSDDDNAGGPGGAALPGLLRRGYRAARRGLGRLLGGGSQAGAATAGTGNLTALYEAEAKRAGIDPRILHGIRAGESLHTDKYDVKSDAKEDSYGPFQLNRRGGLGAQFEKETGLDLHDPKTIPAQTRWVAELIKKQGPGVLRQWYGYRGPRDADPSWGDSGYKPAQSAGDVAPTNGAGGVQQAQGGSIRSQPITDALKAQIATAAGAAGVNAEIYSGGQDESGPSRTGSHRHDHGQSADLKLYVTGQDGKRRHLDMTKETDRVVMEKFIRESVKAGANGVGAAVDYMGPHGIHVGGGSPSAWGAGGASANAPDWVRRAHRQGLEDRVIGAAAAAKAGRDARAAQGAGAAQPASPSPAGGAARPSAAAVRAGATAAVANAAMAQAMLTSHTVNNHGSQDNRRWDDTNIHNVYIQTPATDGKGIMAELKQATRGAKSFVAAADGGTA